MNPINASVIVSTYNAPRPLDLCLAGLSRQRWMPHHILVADDGSGPETEAVIQKWQKKLPVSLSHIWHEDKKNRKSVINNKAVAHSDSDYLIFLDGDAVPNPHWAADHFKSRRPNRILCGRRVKLGPELSDSLTENDVMAGRLDRFFGPVLSSAIRGNTQRAPLGLRLPIFLARCLHPRPRKLMGVNFSLHRKDFETVNGYDEEWSHRRQDKDLDLRLQRAGFNFYPLLNRAIVHHIYHDEREPSESVQQRVQEEAQSDRVFCKEGLRNHLN
jgi:glycosyltransferase involved in cell wall biosynthesis